MKETFYIDSNIFLYPVLYENTPESTAAEKVLKKIENTEITAYTSTLTWDEITYCVFKITGRFNSITAGRKFITFPNLRFIAVDESVISKSQRLMEEYNLHPRDAIHCACALEKGIKKLITNDKHFQEVGEIEVLPLLKI
jgi:predicted nucleic acid-binding protein